jgi:EmrB/QacA subfamily drug resistance transporter
MTALGSCFLVVMMDNTVLNVALQTIQQDLRATNGQLQWAVDSYILCYAALMFSAGTLADAWGRRRLLLAGLTLFAVASAMAAFSGSPEEVIIWRAVMGIGGSVVPPVSLALINDMFDAHERGRAIGIWSALGGLSIALGPITGGLLLQRYWWGSVFLINVPVVIACAALLLILVPGARGLARPRIDLPGVVLSVAGTGAVVYGVIRGGETRQWLGTETVATIGGGLLLLTLLVVVERRTPAPALDLSLLRDPSFAAGTLSLAFAYFALTGGTFLMVFYVQGVRGHSPIELGLTALPIAVGTVCSAATSGRLHDRLGTRTPAVGGLLLLWLSCVGQAYTTAATPLWWYEVVLGLSGLGMGLLLSVATTATMAAVAPEKAAAGSGVSNALRQIGSALGVAVLGSVASAVYQDGVGAAVTALPAASRQPASDSLPATLAVVDELAGNPSLPPTLRDVLPEVRAAGESAYVHAMQQGFGVAALVVGVAAVVTALWLPGSARPGGPARDGALSGEGTTPDAVHASSRR